MLSACQSFSTRIHLNNGSLHLSLHLYYLYFIQYWSPHKTYQPSYRPTHTLTHSPDHPLSHQVNHPISQSISHSFILSFIHSITQLLSYETLVYQQVFKFYMQLNFIWKQIKEYKIWKLMFVLCTIYNSYTISEFCLKSWSELYISVNIKCQIYSKNIRHNIIKWRGNINFNTVFKNLNLTIFKGYTLVNKAL